MSLSLSLMNVCAWLRSIRQSVGARVSLALSSPWPARTVTGSSRETISRTGTHAFIALPVLSAQLLVVMLHRCMYILDRLFELPDPSAKWRHLKYFLAFPSSLIYIPTYSSTAYSRLATPPLSFFDLLHGDFPRSALHLLAVRYRLVALVQAVFRLPTISSVQLLS